MEQHGLAQQSYGDEVQQHCIAMETQRTELLCNGYDTH